MIFPAADRALLSHELGTYGITYADSNDCLIIAPALKGHPERIDSVVGVISPSELVGLLSHNDECVGALFLSASDLIQYYWNGNVPEDIPAAYLSDMIDLCLADLHYTGVLDNTRVLNRARDIHERVRELMQKSGSLPIAVVERIKENFGIASTVH